MKATLKILWVFIEVAATLRAGIATYTVVNALTHDVLYTVFTTLTIEGVFIVSLFLMRSEAVAPIAGILALTFSAVMQLYEIRVMSGVVAQAEKDILIYVIAFAPIGILLLSYVRHLVTDGENPFDLSGVLEKLKGKDGEKAMHSETKTRGRPRGSKRGG